MRLRITGRLRTLTLVPWYEAPAGVHELAQRLSLSGQELREIIQLDSSMETALRSLLAELNPTLTGPSSLDTDGVVARVEQLIEQGVIYVVEEL